MVRIGAGIAFCITTAVATSSAQQPNVDLEAIPQLRITQEVRIGSTTDTQSGLTRVSCTPNTAYGFPNTGCLAVDRDGQVYVFDHGERHIKVYSANGSYVRTIGRVGEGPGEFRSSPGVVQIGIKGDTLWSVEEISLQNRITLFSRRDGAVLSTARMPRPKTPGRNTDSLILLTAGMRANGAFITGNYLRSQSRGAGPTGIGLNDIVRVPRLGFSPEGKIVDTLGWHTDRPPEPPLPIEYVVTAGNVRRAAPRPGADGEIKVMFPEGRFVVHRNSATSAASATLRIRREGLREEVVYDRAYTYRPARFTPAILDAIALASLLAQPGGAGAGGGPVGAANAAPRPAADTSPATRAALRGAMKFPDFQSPVQNVAVGTDGSILLRREQQPGNTQRWLIVGPQGNPRGHVTLPANARVLWSSGDVVWGVVQDEDDVPFVIRWRIG